MARPSSLARTPSPSPCARTIAGPPLRIAARIDFGCERALRFPYATPVSATYAQAPNFCWRAHNKCLSHQISAWDRISRIKYRTQFSHQNPCLRSTRAPFAHCHQFAGVFHCACTAYAPPPPGSLFGPHNPQLRALGANGSTFRARHYHYRHRQSGTANIRYNDLNVYITGV